MLFKNKALEAGDDLASIIASNKDKKEEGKHQQ